MPPTHITGGCLCTSLRYTLSFTPSQWPPQTSNCQCTTCRKWTSTLVSHALLLDASQLQLTKSETYTWYRSSAEAERSFCAKCGSGIVWRSEEKMPGKVVLMVGTVDEEWVMGGRKEGGREEGKESGGEEEGKESEEGGAKGKKVEWEGGFGEELCRPGVSLFWENVVRGVTDFDMGQKKFLQEG